MDNCWLRNFLFSVVLTNNQTTTFELHQAGRGPILFPFIYILSKYVLARELAEVKGKHASGDLIKRKGSSERKQEEDMTFFVDLFRGLSNKCMMQFK